MAKATAALANRNMIKKRKIEKDNFQHTAFC